LPPIAKSFFIPGPYELGETWESGGEKSAFADATSFEMIRLHPLDAGLPDWTSPGKLRPRISQQEHRRT
jgi:hypothetical protein